MILAFLFILKKLIKKYIEKLKTLLEKPLLKEYTDVIQFMIDNRVWLEQESFYNA